MAHHRIALVKPGVTPAKPLAAVDGKSSRKTDPMTRSENTASSGQHGSPQPDEVIQSPYDRLLNRTLQQVESARSLLEFHLPRELVQHLNLDTLAHVDTSLIDRNLRRRFADRLFSVEVSDQICKLPSRC